MPRLIWHLLVLQRLLGMDRVDFLVVQLGVAQLVVMRLSRPRWKVCMIRPARIYIWKGQFLLYRIFGPHIFTYSHRLPLSIDEPVSFYTIFRFISDLE